MKLNGLQDVREIFIMTRNERRGTFVLLILLGILLGVDVSLGLIAKNKPKIIVTTIPEDEVIEKEDKEKCILLHTYQFDPNLISVFDLKKMGVPEYVCKNIEKYRIKGGQFKKSEDLRKIYGISDEFYSQLCDSMIFSSIVPVKNQTKKQTNIPNKIVESSKKEKQQNKFNKRKLSPKSIFINQADSIEFLLVKGIGPVLSKRIIKYRELLGGFYSIDQLKEVYGMKEEVIINSLELFKLDSIQLKKLDVNFATKKEIAAHPYLNWNDAQLIIDLRKKNGFIDEPSVFLYDNFDSSKAVKMIPYFLK